MDPGYDVFLSHSKADKNTVEELAHRLLKLGIRPWLDKWNLVPGEAWQRAIEDALTACASCAIFLGPSGSGPWQNEEMRAAISRRVNETVGRFRVIPVLLPGTHENSIARVPAFLAATTWVRFQTSIKDSDAFHRLVCGIRGLPPGPDPAITAGRSVWKLVLNAKLDDLDRATIDDIIERLRTISDDIHLSLKMVNRGSVVLTVEASSDALDRLVSLITSGDLRRVGRFDIDSIAVEGALLQPPAPGIHQEGGDVLFVSTSDGDYANFRIALPDKWMVYRACTCSEAITFSQKQRVPVMVAEPSLPDGNWNFLLEQLYTLAQSPPHLVVFSRVADEHLWTEVLSGGGYDVIAAPFERSEVVRVIDAVIRHENYQQRRNNSIRALRIG